MSCVYKSQSPTGKTILITTTSTATAKPNGSSAHHGDAGSGTTTTTSSSQQITIFTHHHHHNAGLSGVIGSGLGTGGVASLAVDGRSNVAVNTVSAGPKAPPGSVGINILINNHFNEPPAKSNNGSMSAPGTASNAPTTVTIQQEAATIIKREPVLADIKIEAKTEPLDADDQTDDELCTTVATADSTAAASPKAAIARVSPTTTQTSTTTVTVTSSSNNVVNSAAALCIGDECFACLPDGRFHLGTVVAVQTSLARCLVRFADGNESWSLIPNVQRFSAPEVVQPVCIVCNGESKDGGVGGERAEKCTQCGRAYHPRCAGAGSDGVWFCRRGHRNATAGRLDAELKKVEKVEEMRTDVGQRCDVSGAVTNEERERVSVVAHVKRTLQLPYELSALTWDKKHRHNAEHTYCYCGRNGEWHMQMLQCGHCRQWFHELCCADALSYPLYCGDRFYVFACALCNGGVEFVRRQQIRLDDLVHLLLFNLHVHNAQRRFFDVNTVIVPYAINNWHTLQLSPKLRSMSVAEIRERIGQSLVNHPQRFKQRSALSLRPSLTVSQFALCSRNLPPAAPSVPLPAVKQLTDRLLAQLCRRQPSGSVHLVPRAQSVAGLVALSNEMRYTMSGRAYMKSKADESSSLSSPASSESSPEADQFLSDDDDEVLANFGKKQKLNKLRHQQQKQQQHSVSDATAAGSSDVYDYCSEREDAEANGPPIALRPSPSTSISSNSGVVAPTYKSPATIPSTSPTRNTVDASLNTATSNSNPQPASLSQHRQHKRKRGRTLASSAFIAAALADATGSYSSDDNSSRGALDLIIPPPKDFAGLNNPFLSQPAQLPHQHTAVHLLPATKGRPRGRGRGRGTKNAPIGGVMPCGTTFFGTAGGVGTAGGTVCIVRTVKRRLSARDLVIGPNMEVKRRKVRRSSGGCDSSGVVEVISTATIHMPKSVGNVSSSTTSSSSTVGTMRTDFRDLTLSADIATVSGGSTLQHIVVPPPPPPSLDAYRPEEAYGIGGRRLRKRLDTNYKESGRRSGGNVAIVAAAAAAAAAASAAAAATNSNSCSSSSSSSTGGPASSLSSFSLMSAASMSLQSTSSSSSSSSLSSFAQKITPPTIGATATPMTVPNVGAAPSLTELQSSLTMYFGAANRMENGERFVVRGKRIGVDGRPQYLIEWESGGS